MSLYKLATSPWSPTISTGRKILRTRYGKALNLIKSPYRIFWTYDDGGENDPDLVIWYRGSYADFGRIYNPDYDIAGQVNLPGSRPVYTCRESNYRTGANNSGPTHYWAILTYDHPSSEGRERGMTFWLFGQEIHVTAKRTNFVEGAETYLGYATTDYVHTNRIYVNDTYRGEWPKFIL